MGSAHASWSTVAGRQHALRERTGLVDGQAVPRAPAHAAGRTLLPLCFKPRHEARGVVLSRSLPGSQAPGSRGRRRTFAIRNRPTSLQLPLVGLTRGCGGDPVISEPPWRRTGVSMDGPRVGGAARQAAEVRPARVSLPIQWHRSSPGRSPVEWLTELSWLYLLEEPGRETRQAKAPSNWAVQSWLLTRSQHPCRNPRPWESAPPPGISIITRRLVRDHHPVQVPPPPERGL